METGKRNEQSLIEIDAQGETLFPTMLDRMVVSWQCKQSRPTFKGLSIRWPKDQERSYIAHGYLRQDLRQVDQSLAVHQNGMECSVDESLPSDEIHLCFEGDAVVRLYNLSTENPKNPNKNEVAPQVE